jgi:phosphoglycolate phosphatase-like HAD superfamily hydrolase
MPPLSLREFRNVHTHPSADCYTMLFGRQLAGAEVAWLDRIVRGQYRRFAPSCGLAEDAEWALRDWSRIPGRGQSLLSLRPEHWLAGQVHRLGVAQQFDRVEGLRLLESTDTGKAPLLGEHLEALDVDPAETLLIGDGTDDAEAARLVGCRAVLCSGGWQSRRVLRSTGFPVAGGVREAVELASTRAEQG